jgi:Tol biopolymer transport system component
MIIKIMKFLFKWGLNIYFLLFPVFSLTQEIQITSTQFDHFYPKFSPNGNWILYTRTTATNDTQVYKISSNGGNEIALTGSLNSHFNPNWSHNGQWICYEKKDSTGYHQIYKIGENGNNEIRLTVASVDHLMPEFSPDDNWIVFYRRGPPNNRTQIYKISVNGGSEIQLADFENNDCNVPRWSPDGNWIVFQERDSILPSGTGVWRLYKVNSSGGTEILLTPITAMHEGPDWFPNSSWLVYEFRYLTQGAFSQIYKVSASGGNETQITFAEAMHESPRCSPDGNWIAYERRGNPYYYRQIYKISSNGGIEIPVTTYDGDNHYAPMWSPDGNWITYMRQVQFTKYQIFKISTVTRIKQISKIIPKEFSLFQNFPNPFNSSTKIKFNISDRTVIASSSWQSQKVTLKIYDIIGKEIQTLLNENLEPGTYEISFNGMNLPSGIYFYKLITKNFSKTYKLVLIK